jgi:hypothetical protein
VKQKRKVFLQPTATPGLSVCVNCSLGHHIYFTYSKRLGTKSPFLTSSSASSKILTSAGASFLKGKGVGLGWLSSVKELVVGGLMI